MKYRLKKIAALLISACILCTSVNVFGATKLYDSVTREIVASGVTYEHNQRLNAEGWQDIHVLTIDLNSPNIELAPVESSGEIGKKDTVLTMLNDSGAVAGVNSDFFGMAGTHSASFGLPMDNGELLSVGTDKNISAHEYATFFIDNSGNPFIDFFHADIHFKTGPIDLELASVNKITEMKYPIYFDSHGGSTTQPLDARFPNLVKVVVQNNTITKISSKGEIVTVPEDGYLIIMNGDYYDGIATGFAVGQYATTEFKTTLDLNNIDTAMSGGGKLLTNGQIARNDGVVISGRQPRTALGISQDKTKLILMVVDGRGSSIGATHDELAWLMKEYGAYEAMHLDGGGSSTMVANTINDTQNEVKNTVSDGAERKVMTSIGVFNTGTMGTPVELSVRPNTERAFVGTPISFDFVAYDSVYHKQPVDASQVQLSVPEGTATVNGSTVTPLIDGAIPVTATWNGLTKSTVIYGMTPASIKANTNSIALSVGESSTITVSGVSTEGYTGTISGGVTYELSNPALGTLVNGVFTAQSEGAGYIKCTYNNASTYIAVSVGGTEVPVSSFENSPALSFSSYPSELIKGFAGLSNTFYSDGATSLLLNYTFSQSTATQAAYMDFVTPVTIPGQPSKIKMSVYGNNSGHWLRGKIKDTAGNEYVVDFTKNINWNGWSDVTADIPKGAVYPVSLQTIYVAALSNTNTATTQLCFDNLRAVVPNTVSNMPQDTGIADKFSGDTTYVADGSYYITMTGNVTAPADKRGSDYTTARVNVNNNIQSGSNLAVYAGSDDVALQNSVETIKRSQGGYAVYDKNGVTLIRLQAANGTLSNTNSSQWTSFKTSAISSNDKNVIFMLDRAPSLFTDTREKELFEEVLQDIKNSGKNVFVVYTGTSTAVSEISEGIRYIGLPDLWNSNGTYNQNYKMLRLKVSGDNIVYEFK